jgi:CheY-like chemotaxis protein
MLKILLVDDDREEYEFIASAFESLSVKAQVIQIEDCTDVSAAIREHNPDMVFIDINMPSINGIDCLKSVRSEKRFENLPIIIYSTSNSIADVQESFKHKANLYVVKPNTFSKLTASLQKVLSFDWNLRSNLPIDKFVIA